ncbi:MAG: hypothetical protein WBW44_03070, partial [Solirubrobacterales bacterium]
APLVNASLQDGIVTTVAEDGWGWGVGSIEFRIDGGSWIRYEAPVNVEGVYEYEYRATDLKGNVSPVGLIQVNPRPPARPDPVARINLKLALSGKVKAGRKLKAKATIRNTGTAVIPDLILRPTVSTKIASKPRKATVRRIAPGARVKRTIVVKVKKRAKPGSKLKFKLVAIVAGRKLKKSTRTVRVLKTRKRIRARDLPPA